MTARQLITVQRDEAAGQGSATLPQRYLGTYLVSEFAPGHRGLAPSAVWYLLTTAPGAAWRLALHEVTATMAQTNLELQYIRDR